MLTSIYMTTYRLNIQKPDINHAQRQFDEDSVQSARK